MAPLGYAQHRIVLSYDPETTVPSPIAAKLLTKSVWPVKVFSQRHSASQTFRVQSSEPERKGLGLGLGLGVVLGAGYEAEIPQSQDTPHRPRVPPDHLQWLPGV